MSTQATTPNGVATNSNTQSASPILHTEDDAADAFLSNWSDEDNESSSQASAEIEEEEQESDEPEQGEQDEDEAEDAVEESEESEEDPQEDSEDTEEDKDEAKESKDAKKVLEDDAVVKLKVDDQELEVSVKDLKRLYGQEAALTRKSQEVATKRKEVEGAGVELAAVLDRMYKKAEERYKPYAEIDMLVASKSLDADTFAALRKEAQAAYEDFRFISEEAKGFIAKAEQNKQRMLQEAAKEAVKVLKQDIPNWSSQLYDSIRDYAITNGMDAEVVNNMVDPVAIKLLHKARLYDESKKIATKKKVIAPKKVIKSTNAVTTADTKNERVAKAQQRVRSNGGGTDDVANLFLSRWASDE
jgi:hypothetical protein